MPFRVQQTMLKGRMGKLSIGLIIAFFFVSPALGTELSGGNFRLYADTISVVEGGGVTGGAFYLEGSSEQTAVGIKSTAATGSITFVDGAVLATEAVAISDGIQTVLFVPRNGGGNSPPQCLEGSAPNCLIMSFDFGGGLGNAKEHNSQQFAAAVTSTLNSLGIDAVDNHNGVVTLTNTVVAGAAGNIPMTESGDTGDKFTLVGMSGGSDAGYEMRAGFQAMDQGTISLSVGDTSVDLGQLAAASVATADVLFYVTTNSVRGYTVTVQDDGNLRDGANDIDDVADGTVTAGSEEYGVKTIGGDGQLSSDTGMTTSAATIASRSSSADNVATTMRFSASIDATQTRQGTYAHVVTLSATATP